MSAPAHDTHAIVRASTRAGAVGGFWGGLSGPLVLLLPSFLLAGDESGFWPTRTAFWEQPVQSVVAFFGVLLIAYVLIGWFSAPLGAALGAGTGCLFGWRIDQRGVPARLALRCTVIGAILGTVGAPLSFVALIISQGGPLNVPGTLSTAQLHQFAWWWTGTAIYGVISGGFGGAVWGWRLAQWVKAGRRAAMIVSEHGE